MPSISSHKHISPSSLPQLDEMTYRRAAFRKVSVDPQLNFVNPINRSVRRDRNNFPSTQVVNINELSNTYQSSVNIQGKMTNQHLNNIEQGPRLLEMQQTTFNNTPHISYTQFLQMNNTSSVYKPGSIQHHPSTTSISIVNQITPAKVLKELRTLNDFLDTQEIYYSENLPTSVAQRDVHTELVFSIEKSYRKVIAKVLKQFQKNSVMDDIVLLFKRAIKGLDSVLAQERDFTNKVIEKLQDDYKKAWEAKDQVDLDFEHFKKTETLEAYFAKFKINPTREFRLEIINNVNMWLNGSNADAVDPMMQRDQQIKQQMSSGVEIMLEMLSEVPPFAETKVCDQLSFDDLERDQEKFITYQREKMRKDALSVARVAENNTKKILQISGGKMPTMDQGTNTETWMKVTREFMDRIQQLEAQIHKYKIMQQNQGVEAQRTIESLRRDLKISQEFQMMIRQQVIDSEKQCAYMKQLMESKLSKEANADMDKDLAVFNEKKKETAAKMSVLQNQKNASPVKQSLQNADSQEPVGLESVSSRVELKRDANQDLAVVEDVFTMNKQEIQDFVPVIQKMALVYQVFQANPNALRYKGFYENFDKLIHVFNQVPFLLDQLFVLSQTKDQSMLKILNFGCVGDSQALKKVVDRIFNKTKTNQVEGTNQLCENVIQLNQITYDAAAFISFFNKEKNNKAPAIKKKVQGRLQQAQKFNEKANELFEKLPTEIGLENSRLVFNEALDCYKNVISFFKEHLASKEIANEMIALQNLVQELKNAIAQIAESIRECGDADSITKQFKRLNACILEERERQSKVPLEIVTIMDTPPSSKKVDIQKSLASQLSLDSFTAQNQEEAKTIFVLDEAEVKTDLVSIISKKEEGGAKKPKHDLIEAKSEPEPAKKEHDPMQAKKDEDLVSRQDLVDRISENLIKKLSEQFQEWDYKMVGPMIQESVNQTILSLKSELVKPPADKKTQLKPKVVASATKDKPAVKKEQIKKEVPFKEPTKVKDRPVAEAEDQIVIARQELRIADAISKAVAELNKMHRDEMNRLKSYDDKDNCKACGKPKVSPKIETERQQSEIKQPKNQEVKVKPAAKKVDKHAGKQDESPRFLAAKETQITIGNRESKLLELVVKPPALININGSDIDPDNISFSTQHIQFQTDKDQKEFDRMQNEVNTVEASFVKELDDPIRFNQDNDNSPPRQDFTQTSRKILKPPPQKSEIKIVKPAFQKNFLSTHSFTSSLKNEESSVMLPTQPDVETPFVQVRDENEGYELQTPSKTNTFYENLQGRYSVVPSIPKGHTLLLDQATQTENKKLLRDILVMINEAFFENLEKFESVPQHELQMTIDSFNQTMPQVFEQITAQASTFLVTNSVKYLNPSVSCQKLGKADQEQVNRQRAPLALQDFSRYGQHTLELNQEIKERITVKTIGHIGGGFIGYQKR